MASGYFKNFAIENHLTIDYGYMYGRYKGFFISLKETMGSTKILTIMTTISENKEKLKEILSVFDEEELPTYQISDMKREKEYIQFFFELQSTKLDMVTKFLDKFIESYTSSIEASIICPICGNPIGSEEKTAIIDSNNCVLITHEDCFIKKQDAERKAKEEEKMKATKTKKVIDVAKKSRGPLGAFLYSLIYLAILVFSFFFMQFILNNAEGGDTFVLVFQYSPCLLALSGAPIITAGYDKFSDEKGTKRYMSIFWTNLIVTFIGTFFGFVASLILIADSDLVTLFKLVLELLKAGSTTFRWGFYVYIVVSMLLASLSFVLKINSKAETSGHDHYERLE